MKVVTVCGMGFGTSLMLLMSVKESLYEKRNCFFIFLIFLFEFKNIILHFFQSFL